ncbi:TIGR03943 family putative permease subunit [Paenibacillus psychroresistens]|nr:TIGR03943 family protein [Paenibacillus psychroresistens]
MEQKRSLTGHYCLRAAILTGFAMYILYLVKSDNILYYIAPRNIIYVKLSAIGFYAIAVYQIFLAINSYMGRKVDCECDHPPSRSIIRNTAAYSLFILPLLLGFLLPNSAMGSALAAKRGVNLSSSLTSSNSVTLNKPSVIPTAAEIDPKLKALFKSDKYDEGFAQLGMKLYKKDLIQVKEEGFIETLTSLDMFMNNFIGKKIEISGFVYREDDMQDNQFVVARFSIQCCTADGSPFGMMVKFDQGQKLAKDTWVKITGTINKSTYRGNEIMTLVADKVEKTTPAKSQYVYPNYDYVGD